MSVEPFHEKLIVVFVNTAFCAGAMVTGMVGGVVSLRIKKQVAFALSPARSNTRTETYAVVPSKMLFHAV